MQDMFEQNKANELKWDRRALTYDRKRFGYFRYMQKKAIDQLVLRENINFLDIGCGTGWAVRYIAALLNGNGNFTGIDISNGMVEQAKANSKGLMNIDFIQANSEVLPFQKEYFDSVLCTNSFHHYLHPNRVMHEISRVLKSGGRIYILDVTADDFFIRWINSIVRKREKAHVRFYSTDAYRNMFLESGLKPFKSKRLMYPLRVHIAEK